MRRLLIVAALILAVCLHAMALGKAADAMKLLPKDESQAFVLPSPLLKIAALEFHGIASDILFLKSTVFIGSAVGRKEKAGIKEWEWNWYAKILDASTDLDPYFLDPYLYANAFLPWEPGKVEEANRLLEKGSRYRDWDWRMPFFVGFNDFFFLHKDAEAAPFFMEASRRPGGDPMLASIAARIAFKENRTETAIFFLEETVRMTDDQSLKELYETRIQALQSIALLERGVGLYKKKFGRFPSTVDDLVRRNIINQIPVDPYGGTYSVALDGKVRSTTSSELEPHISPLMRSLH
ncbi:MAG TPA: hypothetical protein VL122_07210 [Nitrospirota bacterium]|nr:hypothetical protein [Nitrospirota bacterium]